MPDRAAILHPALTYCVEFAQLMLADSGSFMPFGAVVDPGGGVSAVAGWNGEDHPGAASVIDMLTREFREDAETGAIIGAALAVDVNMPEALASPWPDGIRVRLEGPNYARLIYVPYRIVRKGLFGRKRAVELADPLAIDTLPEIFRVIA